MIAVYVSLPGEDTAQFISIRRLQHPPQNVNPYEVRLGKRTAQFEHRFDEGWLRCVSLALQALSAQREKA